MHGLAADEHDADLIDSNEELQEIVDDQHNLEDSQKWIMSKTHKITQQLQGLNKHADLKDSADISDSKGGFDNDLLPESIDDSIGLQLDDQLDPARKKQRNFAPNDIDILDSANFNQSDNGSSAINPNHEGGFQ